MSDQDMLITLGPAYDTGYELVVAPNIKGVDPANRNCPVGK